MWSRVNSTPEARDGHRRPNQRSVPVRFSLKTGAEGPFPALFPVACTHSGYRAWRRQGRGAEALLRSGCPPEEAGLLGARHLLSQETNGHQPLLRKLIRIPLLAQREREHPAATSLVDVSCSLQRGRQGASQGVLTSPSASTGMLTFAFLRMDP